MKYFIFLLLLGFTFTISAQEIARLDSIVYDEFTGDEDYTLSFEYDAEDRISNVFNLDEQVDFSFSYNDNGTTDIFIIKEIDEPTVAFKYVYDSEGELDSMNASFVNYGYLIEILIDIEAEAGVLQSMKTTTIYDGYTFVDYDKRFKYTAEGKIDSIIFLDVFVYDGSEIVEEVIDFEYENDKLIAREYSSISYPSSNYKDSIGFFADGTMAFILRVGENPDDFQEFKTEYSDAATFTDGEFIGPKNFFELARDIFTADYSSILLTLNNNSRPVSHIEDDAYFSTEGTWHYTILVNTEEKEIPATAISVYPNPTTDFIRVEIEDEISSMELYSMTGDLLVTKDTKEATLNLEGFTIGNYLLIVRASNGQNYFAKIQKF